MKTHMSFLLTLVLASVAVLSCSIQDYAMDTVADALTGGDGNAVFLEENDPALVGDALPFAIKLYESLYAQNKDHAGLVLTTGSLYVMYANAFLQSPAQMLPPESYEERVVMRSRAKNLYLRGRTMMLDYLEGKYPGFALSMQNGEGIEGILDGLESEDVPYAYWMLAGWFGAISLDSFDLELMFSIPQLMQVLERAIDLDEGFSNGSLIELSIQVYASVPEAFGGSREAAESAFARTLELQEGKSAGPYVSLATAVALPAQDLDRFMSLMQSAMDIDPDENPELRLMNILAQQKAQWYLEHIDEFFVF